MNKRTTVGGYLVKRLEQIGVSHIFGVPGDYVLKFFDLLEESSIDVIGTCNELNAGYAADAYARFKGVGAVCVTYGVGAFSLFNAIAGAYAEYVPVIAICGGPKLSLRKDHEGLLHHIAGYATLQEEIYEKITVSTTLLSDAEKAPAEIDRVINECLLFRRPVFIEIPADIVQAQCDAPGVWDPDMSIPLDDKALKEAVKEALSMIKKAKRPAVYAGAAFTKLGIEDELLRFLKRSGFDVSSTMSSKGMIPENLPNFAGTYSSKLLSCTSRHVIEDADVLLVLGVIFTDFNVGLFTSSLVQEKMIYAHVKSVRIKNHYYENVPLGLFVHELTRGVLEGNCRLNEKNHPSHILDAAYKPRPGARLTSKRFWMRLNRFIEKGQIVVADAGSATLESAAMHLPEGVSMLAQDFYLSIGYSLPASIGVKFAKPESRPVVIIGDGAFQMTCQELSTIIRNDQNPVIFLINNEGYQIERVIYDNVYNDIQSWQYHKLPEIFGGGLSFRVGTEGELEEALNAARENRDEMVFIEVCLGRFDYPPTLEKLGRTLR
jgi:TPP-dependent 2-oxoacid decarboxylase